MADEVEFDHLPDGEINIVAHQEKRPPNGTEDETDKHGGKSPDKVWPVRNDGLQGGEKFTFLVHGVEERSEKCDGDGQLDGGDDLLFHRGVSIEVVFQSAASMSRKVCSSGMSGFQPVCS